MSGEDYSAITTRDGRVIDDVDLGPRFTNHENLANLPNGMGVTWKATSIDNRSLAGSVALNDGYNYFCPIYLPTAGTITGFVYYQGTQGSFTADNTNRIGLYLVTGPNLTRAELVASSANNTSLWKGTANTFVSEALSTPYSAVAGHYLVGWTYQQSAQVTAPTIGYTNGQSWMFQRGAFMSRAFGTAFAYTGDGQVLDANMPDLPARLFTTHAPMWSGAPYDYFWAVY